MERSQGTFGEGVAFTLVARATHSGLIGLNAYRVVENNDEDINNTN